MTKPPSLDGEFKGWGPAHLLLDPMPDETNPPFATLYTAWDNDHLYVGAQVNLRRLPRINPTRFWESDCLELFIDTRGTLTRNEYTEHCAHFFILPPGQGNKTARAGRCEPAVEQQVAIADDDTVRVGGQAVAQGYRLEVALSRDALPTFDPVGHPAIGFNYLLRDATGREQFWTVGRELYAYRDPSTWGILEMVGT